MIIGAIFSEYKILSLQKTLPYIRFGIFALLLNYLLEKDQKFKIFFSKSLLICFFTVLFGLILQLLGFDFITEDKPYSRYTSFFMDESIMGSYLMKILPVTIALFLALKFNKINVLLFLILSSIAIVLSGERSQQFF